MAKKSKSCFAIECEKAIDKGVFSKTEGQLLINKYEKQVTANIEKVESNRPGTPVTDAELNIIKRNAMHVVAFEKAGFERNKRNSILTAARKVDKTIPAPKRDLGILATEAAPLPTVTKEGEAVPQIREAIPVLDASKDSYEAIAKQVADIKALNNPDYVSVINNVEAELEILAVDPTSEARQKRINTVLKGFYKVVNADAAKETGQLSQAETRGDIASDQLDNTVSATKKKYDKDKPEEGTTPRRKLTLKDFFTKKAFKNVKNVLYKSFNLFSRLKNKSTRQEALDEMPDLTDKQQAALSTLEKFRDDFAKVLLGDGTPENVGIVPFLDAPDIYEHELEGEFDDEGNAIYKGNPFGYLIKYDNQGNKFLNENTVSVMAMTGLNWVATQAGNTLFNHPDTINRMLGQPEGTYVNEEAIANLMHSGTSKTAMAETLGAMAFNQLGLQAKDGIDGSMQARMELAMGLAIIDSLLQMELVTQRTFTQADMARFGAKASKQIKKESFANFIRAKAEITVDLGFELHSELETLSEAIKDSEDILGTLFGIESFNVNPLTEPKSTGPTNIKRSIMKVAPKLSDAIANMQQTGWTVKNRHLQVADFLEKDLWLDMHGFERNVKENNHITEVAGIEGKNLGLEREYNNMMGFLETHPSDSPFYFEYEVYKNQRVGIKSNVINPQASKMQRHMFKADGHEVTIDSVALRDVFKKAVMQSFGMKIETFTTEQINEAFANLIQEDVIKEGLKALRAIQTKRGVTKANKPATQQAILAAVEHGGEEGHTLDGLIALNQALTPAGNMRKSFTTDIGLETDGITNGVVIGLMQSFREEPAEYLADLVAAGGVFMTDTHSNFPDWKSASNFHLDNYERLTTSWSNALNTIFFPDEQKEFLKELLGDISNIELGDPISEEARKLSKDPLMIRGYGGGLSKLNRSLQDKAIKAFYKKIVKLAKEKDRKGLNEFVAKFNRMMGGDLAIELPTSFEEILNFELDQTQKLIFKEIIKDTYGAALEEALKAQFPALTKFRGVMNNAFIGMFEMFDYQHKIAIQEATDEINKDRQPDERPKALSKAQFKKVTEDLIELFPAIDTALSEGAFDRLLVMNEDETRDYTNPANTIQFKHGVPLKGTKNPITGEPMKSSSGTISQTTFTEAGIGGFVRAIQSIDSAVIAQVFADHSMLSLFDAGLYALTDAEPGTTDFNKAFYQINKSYSIIEATDKAFNNVRNELLRIGGSPAIIEVNKQINKKHKEFKVPTIQKIGEELAAELSEVQKTRKKYYAKIKVVNQGALQNGSYFPQLAAATEVQTIEDQIEQEVENVFLEIQESAEDYERNGAVTADFFDEADAVLTEALGRFQGIPIDPTAALLKDHLLQFTNTSKKLFVYRASNEFNRSVALGKRKRVTPYFNRINNVIGLRYNNRFLKEFKQGDILTLHELSHAATSYGIDKALQDNDPIVTRFADMLEAHSPKMEELIKIITDPVVKSELTHIYITAHKSSDPRRHRVSEAMAIFTSSPKTFAAWSHLLKDVDKKHSAKNFQTIILRIAKIIASKIDEFLRIVMARGDEAGVINNKGVAIAYAAIGRAIEFNNYKAHVEEGMAEAKLKRRVEDKEGQEKTLTLMEASLKNDDSVEITTSIWNLLERFKNLTTNKDLINKVEDFQEKFTIHDVLFTDEQTGVETIITRAMYLTPPHDKSIDIYLKRDFPKFLSGLVKDITGETKIIAAPVTVTQSNSSFAEEFTEQDLKTLNNQLNTNLSLGHVRNIISRIKRNVPVRAQDAVVAKFLHERIAGGDRTQVPKPSPQPDPTQTKATANLTGLGALIKTRDETEAELKSRRHELRILNKKTKLTAEEESHRTLVRELIRGLAQEFNALQKQIKEFDANESAPDLDIATADLVERADFLVREDTLAKSHHTNADLTFKAIVKSFKEGTFKVLSDVEKDRVEIPFPRKLLVAAINIYEENFNKWASLDRLEEYSKEFDNLLRKTVHTDAVSRLWLTVSEWALANKNKLPEIKIKDGEHLYAKGEAPIWTSSSVGDVFENINLCYECSNQTKWFLKKNKLPHATATISQEDPSGKFPGKMGNHSVALVEDANGVRYIIDQPQKELWKPLSPPVANKGEILTTEFNPRFIEVTVENLMKYYGYTNAIETRYTRLHEKKGLKRSDVEKSPALNTYQNLYNIKLEQPVLDTLDATLDREIAKIEEKYNINVGSHILSSDLVQKPLHINHADPVIEYPVDPPAERTTKATNKLPELAYGEPELTRLSSMTNLDQAKKYAIELLYRPTRKPMATKLIEKHTKNVKAKSNVLGVIQLMYNIHVAATDPVIGTKYSTKKSYYQENKTRGSSSRPIDFKNFAATYAQSLTAENSVQIFNKLAQFGDVQDSIAHQDKLRGLIQDLVNKAIKPLDGKPLAYDVRLNEQGDIVHGAIQGDKIFIQAGKNKGLLGNLNEMSAQEVLTHELIHAITLYAIDHDFALRKQLEKLFNEAKTQLTPQDFLKTDANGNVLSAVDPAAELKAAEERYNYIFHNKEGDQLHEFMAFGLTNQKFGEILSKVNRQPAKYTGNLNERIGQFFQRMMDWINGKINGTHNLSTDQALLKLAENIVETNTRQYSMIMQQSDRFNSLNPFVIDGLYKTIFTPLNNWMEANRRDPNIGKVKRAAVNVLTVPKLVAGTLKGQSFHNVVGETARLIGLTEKSFITKLVREGVGMTKKTIKWHFLLRESKSIIDQARRHLAEVVKADLLENFLTDLTKEDKVAITKVFLKADLEVLFDDQNIEFNDLIGSLFDNTQLERQISRLKGQLAPYQQNANYYINQAESLGHMMATGRPLVVDPMSNAAAIASLGAVNKRNPIGDIAKAERIIDQLATLYAIKYTPYHYRETVVNLINNEYNENDTINGISNLVRTHRAFKERALRESFDGQKMLMFKGYTQEIYNPSIDFKVGLPEDEKDFAQAGYFPIGEVKKDPKDYNKTKVVMYVSKVSNVNTLVKGAASVRQERAKGTPLFNAYYDSGSDVPSLRAMTDTKLIKDRNQREVLKQFTKPAVNQTDPTHNLLVPITDAKGKIVSYRYLMDEHVKDTILEKNNDFSAIMGRMEGAIVDKTNTKIINKKVLLLAKEDYDEDYASNPAAFVKVGKNATDPRYKEIYDMMPESMKKEMKNIWGGKDIYVKEELIDLIFGFRKLSLADWSVAQKFTQSQVGKWLKADMRIRQIENIWAEVVGFAKEWVVIKSGFVLKDNVTSNNFLLWVKGVSPDKIVEDQVEGLRALNTYQIEVKKRDRLIRRLHNFHDKLSATEKRAIEGEIAKLEKSIAQNPIIPLVEAGILQNIVEDIDLNSDDFKYKNKILDKLNPVVEEYVPDTVTEGLKQAAITRDTYVYKKLLQATQYSDFVARYALYKHHLRKIQKKKSTLDLGPDGGVYTKKQEEIDLLAALVDISDTFINYDIPTSPELQYLNDMGFLMFTKFLFRIQKVIFRIFKENPVNVLALEALQQGMIGDKSDITDSMFPDLISRFKGPHNIVDDVTHVAGPELVMNALPI